jgi:hypothetical protein
VRPTYLPTNYLHPLMDLNIFFIYLLLFPTLCLPSLLLLFGRLLCFPIPSFKTTSMNFFFLRQFELRHLYGVLLPYTIWSPHIYTLLVMINYFMFFLCFHMVFNNSLLFMSMPNVNFMEAKRHMLNFFFISMLVDKEKEWNNYKMKVVSRNGGRYSC